MVSYPLRARLKLYAEASLVNLNENPELYDFLRPQDYKFKPEQMMVFKISAYDWNCPQHIVPKYSTEEVREILEPQKKYIESLEAEIEQLKEKLKGQ